MCGNLAGNPYTRHPDMTGLSAFVATREDCADLGERLRADFYDEDGIDPCKRAGFIYEGDTYIERTKCGRFYLILHNQEWISENLAELESTLYSWWMTEFQPDSMADDVHAFLCHCATQIGDWAMGEVIRENARRDDNTCALHDLCDPNMHALAAAGYIESSTDEDANLERAIDRAADIYARASVWLR